MYVLAEGYVCAGKNVNWCWMIEREDGDIKYSWLRRILIFILSAIITLGILFTSSTFDLIGVELLVFPVPNLQEVFGAVYLSSLIMLSILVSGIGEEMYYRVFQGNMWTGVVAEIAIQFFFAFKNLIVGLMVTRGDWKLPVWLFGLSFLGGIILALIRDKIGPIESIVCKIGWVLGFGAWIAYLEGYWGEEIPKADTMAVRSWDPQNIFMKYRILSN